MFGIEIAGNREDGIVGPIEAIEELLHIHQGGVLHMFDVGTDGTPAVGVDPIAERPEQQPYIAVRTVHVALVELFGYHTFLNIKHIPLVVNDVPIAA